eukprot:TRINITY_DN7612_c0_g1_i1.p4 TRINITY_DN7612_c0_g1~~TRINITY_DN7612_c0_g1_i1.p4  ORF type:complete len:63 (+),score=11.58 TRINITY_DN7612_c0_g1_i1:459-647(+)
MSYRDDDELTGGTSAGKTPMKSTNGGHIIIYDGQDNLENETLKQGLYIWEQTKQMKSLKICH